jgi:hypothetical protein
VWEDDTYLNTNLFESFGSSKVSSWTGDRAECSAARITSLRLGAANLIPSIRWTLLFPLRKGNPTKDEAKSLSMGLHMPCRICMYIYNHIYIIYYIHLDVHLHQEKVTRIEKLSFQQFWWRFTKKWSPSKKVIKFAGGFLQSVLLFQTALQLRYVFLSVCAWCL